MINDVFNIYVNDDIFRIKIMEEAQGPSNVLCSMKKGKIEGSVSGVFGSDDDSDNWEEYSGIKSLVSPHEEVSF